MAINIRQAELDDADQMMKLLNTIIEIGGTTAYTEKFNKKTILENFIMNEFGISCFVAIEEGDLLGFQSIERPDHSWSNEDKTPQDFAIISTYVDVKAHKNGVGTKLFEYTLNAAKDSGVKKINARIKIENKGGHKYYSKMGFKEYKRDAEKTYNCFTITG